MTREEAIKQLKDNRVLCINSETEPFAIAYDLAIKALEQEPTTKNDLGVEDCISRKAVDGALYDYWHDIQCVDDSGFGVYQDSMEVINNLPSVTPQEPRTGHWIEQNNDYYDWYECSECGYGSEGEMLYSSEVDVRTNYCPHCGTKMEVEE